MTDPAARRLAEALDRRGLALPARLLADAHRPLAPLLGDLESALGPLVSAAAGERADDARRLLGDADGLDRLIEELDHRLDGGTRAEPG